MIKKHYVLILSLIFFSISANKNLQEILPDIEFWLNQFREHAEFASNFTNDTKLREKGLVLAERAKSLSEFSTATKKNQDQFLALCDSMKNYQNKVMSHLKKDKQRKSLEIDLLDHMNQETKYARQKAQGKKFTKTQEANFWNTEHKGQAKVMTQLINSSIPGAANLKEDANNVLKQLEENEGYISNSDIATVERANEELNAIGEQLKQDPKKSNIPEKLAAHEERERHYAENIFKKYDSEQSRSN
jgi:hypothetical protein